MNRLQKFVEQGACGEKPGRTAYAFGSGNLPELSEGLEWKPVTSFRPAEELMENAGLKEVFKPPSRMPAPSSAPPETNVDKQKKTAAELEEIVKQRIGAGDFKVTVHRNPDIGWHARSMDASRLVHRCQVIGRHDRRRTVPVFRVGRIGRGGSIAPTRDAGREVHGETSSAAIGRMWK